MIICITAVFSTDIVFHSSRYHRFVSLQTLAPVKMADVLQPDSNSLQIPSEIHTQTLTRTSTLVCYCSPVQMTHFSFFICWTVEMLTFPCPSPTWVYCTLHIPVAFPRFHSIPLRSSLFDLERSSVFTFDLIV